MPDYGSEVLDAAATAISDARRGPLSGALSWTEADYARALARAALDAAAPLLAESVAEKILAHMEKYEPPGATGTRWRARRRHFSITARIAAGAFTTREESLRLAAEAMARGDFVACPVPEGGRP